MQGLGAPVRAWLGTPCPSVVCLLCLHLEKAALQGNGRAPRCIWMRGASHRLFEKLGTRIFFFSPHPICGDKTTMLTVRNHVIAMFVVREMWIMRVNVFLVFVCSYFSFFLSHLFRPIRSPSARHDGKPNSKATRGTLRKSKAGKVHRRGSWLASGGAEKVSARTSLRSSAAPSTLAAFPNGRARAAANENKADQRET